MESAASTPSKAPGLQGQHQAPSGGVVSGFTPGAQLAGFLEHFSPRPDFDMQIFTHLYEDTNEDTVIRILAHFNENLKEGVLRMEGALAAENCEDVWKTSHKIAGSAELLGFKPYADRSRHLSRQIRANPNFESHADEIRDYLRETAEISRGIATAFPSLTAFL